MEYVHAIILGIIQGLTEFLPISSSGHLMLIPVLTKWEYLGKYFDVALHFGTFIALLIYYRHTVIKLIKNFFLSFTQLKELKTNSELRLPWLLVASVIPGGIAGVFFEDIIEKILSSPLIASICLIVFGILLYCAELYSTRLERHDRPTSENLSLRDALLIGCSQAVALIPGVSRSGITMTASMLLGMTKEHAANFSFLMSIPIVGGAAVYSTVKMLTKSPEIFSSLSIFVVGILAAGISGYFVINFLLNYIKKDSFAIFMYYRIGLGLIILVMFLLGSI